MASQVAGQVTDHTTECARIAEQNDAFRKREQAGGSGKWVWTTAIDDRGHAFLAACLETVAAYDGFTEDNDPYATHEMGFMDVHSEKVWWRIDLYNRNYTEGSSDPASLTETRRVLTVLFPSDY